MALPTTARRPGAATSRSLDGASRACRGCGRWLSPRSCRSSAWWLPPRPSLWTVWKDATPARAGRPSRRSTSRSSVSGCWRGGSSPPPTARARRRSRWSAGASRSASSRARARSARGCAPGRRPPLVHHRRRRPGSVARRARRRSVAAGDVLSVGSDSGLGRRPRDPDRRCGRGDLAATPARGGRGRSRRAARRSSRPWTRSCGRGRALHPGGRAVRPLRRLRSPSWPPSGCMG